MENIDQLRVRQVFPGMAVAVFTCDKWYRGEVICVSSLDVFVHLVDYGCKKYVKLDKLHYLEKTFAIPSRKTCKGSLFAVKPAGGELMWSADAINSFKAKTKGKKILATIKAATDDGVYELLLIDNPTDRKRIAHELTFEGFAENINDLNYSMNLTLVRIL